MTARTITIEFPDGVSITYDAGTEEMWSAEPTGHAVREIAEEVPGGGGSLTWAMQQRAPWADHDKGERGAANGGPARVDGEGCQGETECESVE